MAFPGHLLMQGKDAAFVLHLHVLDGLAVYVFLSHGCDAQADLAPRSGRETGCPAGSTFSAGSASSLNCASTAAFM